MARIFKATYTKMRAVPSEVQRQIIGILEKAEAPA